MKLNRLILGAAVAAGLAFTSCNSNDDDPVNNYYSNIVTVRSVTASGTSFTFRNEGDSQLITYTTTQPVSGDATKVGDRIVITYQIKSYDQQRYPESSLPFCDAMINVLGAIPTVGGGGQIPVATAEETGNFKSDAISMNSVWRSGEYINVIFIKQTNTNYKQCRLVADQSTLDEAYPHVYLIFENPSDFVTDSQQYAFYMSYSLVDLIGDGDHQGIILHYNDQSDSDANVKIERGLLGGAASSKPEPMQ